MIRKNFTANIQINEKDFQKQITQIIKDKFTVGFPKQKPKIEQVTKRLVQQAIVESNTTNSLLRFFLADYFGLSPSTAQTIVNDLIENIINKVKVDFKIPNSGNVIALIEILFLGLDVKELDDLSKYVSAGKYGGGEVHPLRDLLTM